MTQHSRHRITQVVAHVVVVATMAGLLAGCGGGGTADASASASATTGGSPCCASPSSATTTPKTTATTTTTVSAATQLAPFFAASRLADTRLEEAAKLINAGITAQAVRITPATRAAVEAADPMALARTIPAGLSRDLLRAVLLVYSDIDSRRWAMEPVASAGNGEVVFPRPGPTDVSPSASEILRALKNGGPAAARFESDLAAALTLARSTPPFTVAGARSRAAAELAVRRTYIDVANGGCSGNGGAIFPQLAPLTWGSGKAGSWYGGTVGGIDFRTDYKDGRWLVAINAC